MPSSLPSWRAGSSSNIHMCGSLEKNGWGARSPQSIKWNNFEAKIEVSCIFVSAQGLLEVEVLRLVSCLLCIWPASDFELLLGFMFFWNGLSDGDQHVLDLSNDFVVQWQVRWANSASRQGFRPRFDCTIVEPVGCSDAVPSRAFPKSVPQRLRDIKGAVDAFCLKRCQATCLEHTAWSPTRST